MQQVRWGDKHLSACWLYIGHLVREGQEMQPSVAGALAAFRDLPWWEQQQEQQQGKRRGAVPGEWWLAIGHSGKVEGFPADVGKPSESSVVVG